MLKFFWLLLLLLPLRSLAQVTDNFNDGDFTSNPEWVGDNNNNWSIVNGQLRSNSATASSVFYITTPVTLASSVQWELFVNLQFNTSSANYVDVFLVSQESNLTSSTNNGYFVRIGGTSDEISLFKVAAGLPPVLLIDGLNGTTNTSNANVRIRVSRNIAGNWTLLRDLSGGTNFSQEGVATDNAFTTSNYFGIRIVQSTVSFHLKHFFDDVSILDPTIDATSPNLEAFSVQSPTQLQLQFSETLDATTAQTPTNYSVDNNVGNATNAELQPDGKTVLLTFANPFPNADSSRVTVSNIADVAGNTMAEATRTFFFFEEVPAALHDIVFTEIFADPTPSIGLPEAEYVELYNRSNKIFNLANWKYKDATTERSLPQKFLRPGEYLVLVNNSLTSLFSSFNNVLGVSSFPTLTNTGEPVAIVDESGLTIDSIFYDDDWYGSDETKAGGYSLERISTENFCAEHVDNWIASTAVLGGTPGESNSVLDNTPDTTGPKLAGTEVISSTEIRLLYSEKLSDALPPMAAFLWSPAATVQSVVFTDSSLRSITLTLAEPLTPSVPYTVTSTGILDCAGNAIDEEADTAIVVLPEQAQALDVIITEIFADPTPVIGLPEAEFVELYNRSEKIIDLKSYVFSDGASNATLPSYLLYPHQYAVLTSTAFANLFAGNNVLGIGNFPTLNNAGELIVVKNSEDIVIDSLRYATAWYQDEDKQSGGYSLERRDLNNFCLEAENWRASVDPSGGTPRVQNSVFTTQADVQGPELRSILTASQVAIELEFNEKLSETIPSISHFAMRPSLAIATVNTGGNKNKILLTLAEAMEPGVVYKLVAKNIFDCTGNVTLQTDSLAFGMPAEVRYRDVVISEIMADPSPSQGLPEVEYIEVYNRTDRWVQLNGTTLADATDTIALPAIAILPFGRAVLVSSSASAAVDTLDNAVRVVNFISLNNAGERIVLRSGADEVIDSVRYSNTWFQEEAKREGGWSLERIDPDNFCVEEFRNWTGSIATNGGTPGTVNSVDGLVDDRDPPVAVSVAVQSRQTILLSFNEKIANNLAPSFVATEPDATIQDIVFADSSRKQVLVTFADPLAMSVPYVLTLSQWQDCAGNEQEQTVAVVLPEEAQPRDVLISEIMADPSPTVGLPDEEYIELVNRSNKYIDLKDWKVRDGTSEAVLPAFILPPHQYGILTRNAEVFPSFGKAIHVLNLPTLTNSGESLVLVDPQGVGIDSVNYSLNWYKDENKQQGGWSLERRDLENFCVDEENWKASENAIGGTPGTRNSVFTTQVDTLAPHLLNAKLISPTELKLFFNETLSEEALFPIDFTIEPTLPISDVAVNAQEKTVTLSLASAATVGVVYSVTVNTLRDCTGNAIEAPYNTTLFGVPATTMAGDVVINEIMADPTPARALPEAEFIELYNRSNKLLQLLGWKLTDGRDTAVFASTWLLPFEHKVVTSNTSAHLFSNGNALGLSNFLSLANAGETLSIFNEEDVLLDSITYSSKWYNDSEKEAGGWSLERRDLDQFCFDFENWAASENELGGTPGFQNSVYKVASDTIAPGLVNVRATSLESIEVTFSEVLPTTLPRIVDFELNPVVQIVSLQNDREKILMRVEPPLQAGVLYKLTVDSVADCAGNRMHRQTSSQFGWGVQGRPRDVVINEIMADPSPAIGLPEAEYVELYNRTDKLVDVSNWKLTDGRDTAVFQRKALLPHEYVVLAGTTAAAQLQVYNGIGFSNFPSLNNSGEKLLLLDSSGVIIDSVTYSIDWVDEEKREGGYSLEQVDADNACLPFNKNWKSSTDSAGGTPGFENAVRSIVWDAQPPQLLSVVVQDTAHLVVTFTEKIATEMDVSHFSISPARSISHVSFADASQTKVVVAMQSLLPSVLYTLSVSGLADCLGNSMDANTKDFVVTEPAAPLDVLITEIMADPTPTVALPETEFVELFNRSNKYIDLTGWRLRDGASITSLSTFILAPRQYVVLTANASIFSNGLAAAPFPSLNNEGEVLVVTDASGKAIDSVAFSMAWYKDSEKVDGGWSLERMDLDNFCLIEENWKASEHAAGGTPGFQNSIFSTQVDVTKPGLVAAQVVGNREVELTFSEKLQATVPLPSSFAVLPSLNINTVVYADNSLRRVRVLFQQPLADGVVYTITANAISDCSGNELEADRNTTMFGVPTEATQHDVLINEIMADPSPAVGLPEAEFVELYNRTNKFVDLNNWILTDKKDTATFSSVQLLPYEHLIVTTTSVAAQLAAHGRTLGLVNFPGLNNEGETLVLSNGLHVIDSVQFLKSWYTDSEKAEGGWSLERMDENQFCLQQENWRAATNLRGGTPGKPNSVKGTVVDTEAPSLLSVSVLTSTRLMLKFSEGMDTSRIAIVRLSPTVPVGQISFANKTQMVVDLGEALTEGVVYSVDVSNTADCSGNAISESASIGLAASAEYKNVIITEIMADPSPVVGLPEVEYIEVLNRSNKLIDLNGWRLRDATRETSLTNDLLLPGEYRVLCSPANAAALAPFGKVHAVSGFPSLTNSGKAIALASESNTVIDSVSYTLDWYNDSEKAEGGWSLELIDVNNTCGEEENWKASEANNGGTPGRVNSVNGNKPDLTGPQLVSVVAISETQLLIHFDEKLEAVTSPSQFEMQPSGEVLAATFTDLSLRSVRLTLAASLQYETLYTITANVFDCAGNSVQPAHNVLSFALPVEGAVGDVVINEILFNPRPFGADFVELYNASDKFLNLREWRLARMDNETVVDEVNIANEDFLFQPRSFLVLTSDPLNIQTEYPQSNGKPFKQVQVPAMNDDEGSVVLVMPNGSIIDNVQYTDNLHSPLLKDKEGVSLERIAANEWKSGVIATNFATPGYKNANASPAVESADQVTVDPEIFEPVTGFPNFTSIYYRFDNAGFVAHAKVLDAQGRLVKNIANNEVLANEGRFTWDGDQNDGTQARIGYYIFWLEVFDTSGIVKTFRKRMIIASKFYYR